MQTAPTSYIRYKVIMYDSAKEITLTFMRAGLHNDTPVHVTSI